MRIYEHLSCHRLHKLEGILGDYLVITMVKCGGLDDALNVFYTLSCHSVYAWTAIISGFAENGQAEWALELHEQMKKEGIEPNHYTFVSLLKACGSVALLTEGHALHAEIEKKGWACNVFIGSSLVSMYGKCGRLEDAEDVFMNLLERNTITWNAMLSAYVQQEQNEKALQLYRQMVEETVSSNDVTIVIVLQACGSLASEDPVNVTSETRLVILLIIQALHAMARKGGWTHNIGCTLVSVYGKCSSIQGSENVFIALPSHDVIAWNSMTSAYVENNHVKSGLQLFCHMQHTGVSPDEWTFVSALHACSVIAESEKSVDDSNNIISPKIGEALHKDLERMGLESHTHVANSLLTMYNKIGSLMKAESVFAGLHCPILVSCNAMLSAYVDHGHEELALQLYRQMCQEKRRPNEQTYTITIHACGNLAARKGVLAYEKKLAALELGLALHSDALRSGFGSNSFVVNTLISMYSSCGRLTHSEYAFQDLSAPNIISWNAMLSAYLKNNNEVKTLRLFHHMLDRGVTATKLTFRIVLQSCSSLLEDKDDLSSQQMDSLVSKTFALKVVQALHTDLERMGYDKDLSIVIYFINVYSKCEMLADAVYLFQILNQKDIMSCNVMLCGFVGHGLNGKALHLYREMLLNFGIDEVTIMFTLQACSDLAHIDESRVLHFILISAGYDCNLLILTTLIHTYGYCSSMVDAEAIFSSLIEPDVVSWSACLAGYAREGNHLTSLHCFTEMNATGVEPNRVAFLSLLHSCSHTGLTDKGLEYVESMTRDFGMESNLKCFAGIIDLLGRAGDFSKLKKILQRFPIPDDLAVWLCLLNVCSIHGNIELGRQAFDYAINLQPKDSASYVLMANMCAYQDMLNSAEYCGYQEKVTSFQNNTGLLTLSDTIDFD
ncbi:hypothetical protein KP509_1Z025200 [Ceratopteris richardii]|nr:hypothetical protein KP509_1Z025200 [Ceratopteris richardii]